MSLIKAYSLDLKVEINAKEADIAYQKGKIASQRNFRCPHETCNIAVTCANLERPKHKRKVDPYFKSVEYHNDDCPYAEQDDRKISKNYDEDLLYENIVAGDILINLAEPTIKKQNNCNEETIESHFSRQIIKNSKSNNEKRLLNQRKTLSVLVTSFLNDENFEINLPKPYEEKILLKDAFVHIDGQKLSDFEQNCWRIFYGKAWINKLLNGDYKIVFDSPLYDSSLEKGQVRPSFFIPKQWIDDSSYQKFSSPKMDELVTKKWPRTVFILADVPALNHSQKYINFMLEGLPYLEMLYLK